MKIQITAEQALKVSVAIMEAQRTEIEANKAREYAITAANMAQNAINTLLKEHKIIDAAKARVFVTDMIIETEENNVVKDAVTSNHPKEGK